MADQNELEAMEAEDMVVVTVVEQQQSSYMAYVSKIWKFSDDSTVPEQIMIRTMTEKPKFLSRNIPNWKKIKMLDRMRDDHDNGNAAGPSTSAAAHQAQSQIPEGQETLSCLHDVIQSKRVYFVWGNDGIVLNGALEKARQNHERITLRKNEKFARILANWLQPNREDEPDPER